MDSKCTEELYPGRGASERESYSTVPLVLQSLTLLQCTSRRFVSSTSDDEVNVLNIAIRKGYVLGLILAAATDSQKNTPHTDVVHVTAHFLQSVAVLEYEIRIRRIRQGKNMSNIDVELLQAVSTETKRNTV